MTTCIKCRQEHSEPDHSCLESMSLEEFYALSDEALVGHLTDAVAPDTADVSKLATFFPLDHEDR